MTLRLFPFILCGFAVWGWGTSPVSAANDPISEKIERERKTLEQLKDKIEEKRKRADEAEKKRESVLQGIQSLDERLVRTRQEHQEINKKLRKKDREIETITEQLRIMRGGIQERRDAILARLRVQYMEGRGGYLKRCWPRTRIAMCSAGCSISRPSLRRTSSCSPPFAPMLPAWSRRSANGPRRERGCWLTRKAPRRNWPISGASEGKEGLPHEDHP